MRWDGQAITADDGALPGLERPALSRIGLMRSVRTPEFAGITFHEVAAKSALSHVPAASRMPFRWTVNPYRGCSHACAYCVAPTTLVLMADGRQKPIGDLVVGDRIIGTRRDGTYRRYVQTEVLGRWSTVKRAFRVTLQDGTQIVASGDHRFLTGRGWKHVARAEPGEGQRPFLTTRNALMGFGLGMASEAYAQPTASADYRRGYLAAMIRGDGMRIDKTYRRRDTGAPYRVTIFRLALADDEALARARELLAAEGIPTSTRPFSPASATRRPITAIYTSRRRDLAAIDVLCEWPTEASFEWSRGFLAGIFDAEGSCSRGVLRVSNADEQILRRTSAALDRFAIPNVRERARPNGVATIRVTGGESVRRRFFHLVDPAISRKLAITGAAVKTSAPLGVVAVEDLGYEQEMVDITTGTGDFVADGVIAHNCFARPTHQYLDLDAGKDFDSQVVVKVNVAEVLRAELAKKSWRREPVALGTNTDPYQRAEGRYRLMPGIITALADSGTPFSILTKGTLMRRDLPLIAQAAGKVEVGLGVSLAFADEELQQLVEPGTPTPRARLDLIRAVRAAGLPCGVMVAPVLPWLTDSRDHLRRLLDAIAEAGATGVTVIPLHLKPGTREWYLQWLERDHPRLVAGYGRVFGRGTYSIKAYQEWLWERVKPLLDERGFGSSGHRRGSGATGRPHDTLRPHDDGDYPAGSIVEPAGALAGMPVDGTGLTVAGAGPDQTLF
ncbi:intein-containing Rv2578c family radical SAM protein [Puerhibacterium puerhi]|uniref:intein-containing Rv2578c family radical SAM protein n=1 Tax=Puerhibacterium puerhi TaxID=2692623 RepID=UPI001358B6CC|nr:intein-containing Rv2578c family radical SAM protein [Puerhibacterium puerhi]